VVGELAAAAHAETLLLFEVVRRIPLTRILLGMNRVGAPCAAATASRHEVDVTLVRCGDLGVARE
jgi:hypothetical protein